MLFSPYMDHALLLPRSCGSLGRAGRQPPRIATRGEAKAEDGTSNLVRVLA